MEVSDPGDILMQEEIFGPILPLFEYSSLDEALAIVRSKQKVIQCTQSGSVGINETVVHFINTHLPFGGVGKSGMGREGRRCRSAYSSPVFRSLEKQC